MEASFGAKPSVWKRVMKKLQSEQRHHKERGGLYRLDQGCRAASTLLLLLALSLSLVAFQCDLIPRLLLSFRRVDVIHPSVISDVINGPCVTRGGPCPVKASGGINHKMVKTSGGMVGVILFAGLTVVTTICAFSLTLIANWPGMFQFQRPYAMAACLQVAAALETLGVLLSYHVTGWAIDDVIVVCWLAAAIASYMACVLLLFPSLVMVGMKCVEKKPSPISVFVIEP